MTAETNKRQALYMGERVRGYSRKVQQLFVREDGAEIWFSGIRGVFPGNCYFVTLKEDSTTIAVRPEKVPPEEARLSFTAKDWEIYEAQKLIVKAARLENRKALEIKRPHKDIAKAIELLRPFARNLSSYELLRFCSYLQNEISKKGKK